MTRSAEGTWIILAEKVGRDPVTVEVSFGAGSPGTMVSGRVDATEFGELVDAAEWLVRYGIASRGTTSGWRLEWTQRSLEEFREAVL